MKVSRTVLKTSLNWKQFRLSLTYKHCGVTLGNEATLAKLNFNKVLSISQLNSIIPFPVEAQILADNISKYYLLSAKVLSITNENENEEQLTKLKEDINIAALYVLRHLV